VDHQRDRGRAEEEAPGRHHRHRVEPGKRARTDRLAGGEVDEAPAEEKSARGGGVRGRDGDRDHHGAGSWDDLPLFGADPHELDVPPFVFSMYSPRALRLLLAAVRRHHVNRPVILGTYGVSRRQARRIHRLPVGRYAPIFSLHRTSSASLWAARRAMRGPQGQRLGRTGAIPTAETLVGRSRAEQIAWGRELGRRMRDRMRAAGAGAVDTWQLDEIWPSLSLDQGRGQRAVQEATRYFLVGVLGGLRHGRPQLGDRSMAGLVHISQPQRLAALSTSTPGNAALVRALDRNALRVIGEEYAEGANLDGPAAVAARRLGGAKRVWAHSRDPHARSLARRYIAGVRPGHLGVVVQDIPAAWQRAYLDARAGVAGISTYNWTHGNASRQVIERIVAELQRWGARRFHRDHEHHGQGHGQGHD
jgi:hypothetical protein